MEDGPTDPIHARIVQSAAARAATNTRVCSRLRGLRQLGCATWAFPSAEHSRLPHSLGVGHLARRAASALAKRHPELDVRVEDITVIELAGLLHDIGHGPFSHVFEHKLLPALGGSSNWHHEAMSMRLVDRCIDQAGLDLDTAAARRIKDAIAGDASSWPAERRWMGQVVANACSAIDVDKLDYLARDALATGLLLQEDVAGVAFDLTSLFDWAHVQATGPGGQPAVCFDAGAADLVAEVFRARTFMHNTVYQHHRVQAAEAMLVACLTAANHLLRLHERAQQVDSFLELDDAALLVELRQAVAADPKGLTKAGACLQRLNTQDFWPCLLEAIVPELDAAFTESFVVAHQQHNSGCMLAASDVHLYAFKIDHTAGAANPLQRVWLWDASSRELLRASDRVARLWDSPDSLAYRLNKVRLFLKSEQPGAARAAEAAFRAALRARWGSAVHVTAVQQSLQPAAVMQQLARQQCVVCEWQQQQAPGWGSTKATRPVLATPSPAQQRPAKLARLGTCEAAAACSRQPGFDMLGSPGDEQDEDLGSQVASCTQAVLELAASQLPFAELQQVAEPELAAIARVQA